MLWSDTLEHKEHKKMNKNSRITQTHSCLSRTTLEIKATTVSYTSLLHFHLSFFFTNCSQTLCTFCFRSTSSRSSCLLYLSLAAAESANLRDMHWTYTFRVCVRSIDTFSAFLRRRRKRRKGPLHFVLSFFCIVAAAAAFASNCSSFVPATAAGTHCVNFVLGRKLPCQNFALFCSSPEGSRNTVFFLTDSFLFDRTAICYYYHIHCWCWCFLCRSSLCALTFCVHTHTQQRSIDANLPICLSVCWAVGLGQLLEQQ